MFRFTTCWARARVHPGCVRLAQRLRGDCGAADLQTSSGAGVISDQQLFSDRTTHARASPAHTNFSMNLPPQLLKQSPKYNDDDLSSRYLCLKKGFKIFVINDSELLLSLPVNWNGWTVNLSRVIF